MEPLFLLLFLITTFNPIFSDIDFSKSLILGSMFLIAFLSDFFEILTRCSACLTDSFFSTILVAKKSAFSKPTKILACPALIFFSSTSLITSSGSVK